MKKLLPLFFLFVFAANSFGQSVNGLVAYYPFSGNAADSSGNHHDGVIKGTVTLTADRFGHPNSAYHFDGASGYINCPNDSQLLKSKNISFSVWFLVQNRTGGWDQNVILSNVGQYLSSGGFQAYTSNAPGTYNSDFRNATHKDQYLQGKDSIQPDVWYNLTVVIRHDSLPDSTMVINYLNGMADDSGRFAGSINYDAISLFFIGANRDFGCCQRYFLGNIDEVRLYNRALSNTEVTGIVTGLNITDLVSDQPRLFPNPSGGIFEIDKLPFTTTGKISLEVVNLTGQIVVSEFIDSNQGKIKADLHRLSSGLYMIRLKKAGFIYQVKWVKE